MPTDHEEPCGFNHRSFCLNGGICYVIPSVPSPFCRCIENYTGARCEEIFLPSSSVETKSDLFTTYLVLAVLGMVILAAFCFFCRKTQRNNSAQYDITLVETCTTSALHIQLLPSIPRLRRVHRPASSSPAGGFST
ncbi:PREDICTED: pro-neuregulin-4, membrane-bound isoform [Elephantulus edwardii]|uniref:pro-neuregulin-4, membrane-bound isoform n=1 Tax=Elephantulus edwardii TaxID=28737 RepID=UPI0003F069FA|nr:PREDICTED: pro-neuregulin-4, membrane-bound isoform [Elephantulus edwardii]